MTIRVKRAHICRDAMKSRPPTTELAQCGRDKSRPYTSSHIHHIAACFASYCLRWSPQSQKILPSGVGIICRPPQVSLGSCSFKKAWRALGGAHGLLPFDDARMAGYGPYEFDSIESWNIVDDFLEQVNLVLKCLDKIGIDDFFSPTR